VERGHDVTVLTSHYQRELPREELLEGVRVVRVPVAFRLSKGVIMPSFGFQATRLVKEHDVISAHLPQFDAWGLALRARLFNKPCVITYHCDLQLPGGGFNRFVERATSAANHLAAMWADRIVVNTQDYAEASPFLRRYRRKTQAILPPVVMPEPDDESVRQFRRAYGLEGRHPVFGFAARLATEKGVEVLVDAAPELTKRFPHMKVLFVGPYKDVIGEEGYRARILPGIEAMGDAWQFLGILRDQQMPAFYNCLDCLLSPSLNMTESFGMVQVEAMLCGTPVVASDLPGVRQPVHMTGMGETIPVGDSGALVEAVTRVVEGKAKYVRPRAEIEAAFGLARTVDSYERLFEYELARRGRRAADPAVRTRV